MRGIGLIIVVAIASFGSIASAEKVKTNQEAKLLNHPGEQGAVLLHLKEGQTMTLLSEEGRWLKVRVQGRTGFVPRSKVDMPDNTEIARNTRRRPFVDGRGTRRGFDSSAGPDDRVGADATGQTATKDDGDDDTAKKPAAKKPAKASSGDDDDDDDDTAKKPAAKKPAVVAKKPAPKKTGDDDDDDDDTAKKPAAKKPAVVAKKPAKASSGDDDDDDDDTAKKPAAKAAPKKVATKAPAKKASGDDDDDDDDSAKKPAAKKEASKGDDDDAPKKPMAKVGERVKTHEERSKTSTVAFVAKPGDKLYIDQTKGDWTRIENDDGDSGWVLSSDLLVDGPSEGGAPHKMAIDAAAQLGVTFIQQGMRSVGSTLTGTDLVPDAYNINASAATIAIGGELLVPMGPKLSIGGELAYNGSKTVGGGIVYKMTSTGFTIHDVNLRALAAYDLHRPSGMQLIGHLGLRYRAYLVDGYQSAMTNPARIPQETLTAPTIGAALDMPKLGDKYGLRVGIDAILFGASISQTAGLEDGLTPSMKDFEANARFTYRWKPTMDIVAMYDLDYGSYDFGGMNTQSTRGHTGTDTTRTDILHMVSFGIAMGF